MEGALLERLPSYHFTIYILYIMPMSTSHLTTNQNADQVYLLQLHQAQLFQNYDYLEGFQTDPTIVCYY
jgi:hypothetical protein